MNLATTVKTIDQKPNQSRESEKRISLHDHLIEAESQFFVDQYGTPMAYVRVDDHFECWGIESPKFRSCLRRICDSQGIKTPSASRFKKLTQKLIDIANLKTIALGNRFAERDGKLFIDLANTAWEAIQIDDEGWSVIQPTEPVFRRESHQKSLPNPVECEDSHLLFKHLPIDNSKHQLLILCWLLSAMNCSCSSPILLQIGPPGSAKSTMGRRLRGLLDPSIIPELGELERKNLLHIAQHHAVPFFDNLGELSSTESDFFCRVTTGGGIEKRKLYTDAESYFVSYRSPVIMNDLQLPTLRTDFLDRCIVLRTERQRFKRRSELDAAFKADAPRILGGLLNLLVKAVRAHDDDTEASLEFRMADFAYFGRCVAVALGKRADDFDEAYRESIENNHIDLIEESVVLRSLISLVRKEPISATATELLKKLKDHATTNEFGDKPSDWPSSPRNLSCELDKLRPVLEKRGVMLERERTSSERLLKIELAKEEDQGRQQSSIDASDDVVIASLEREAVQ